ncbi:helix-turn-helix domain-containing GNAT family N-acetyltransferase [Nocardia huaxiensis]|uniref:Metalloregulator ArsR/SmtB family transcription factor n=1 Tax=Nocardia huaxiensis TaxID=2755382 RepID=A0A7D6ZHC7_9NOCA|nr:metalloregulator ArsR/SmtB family transcription factor [Nocardia huaxiensis]QLY28003.1 metalloregulator ArsR/SmtB family transcription factor [Nocardia huaxiensis]UFS98591.1 metalloregulator ArsR/SmtB family transcription factor [Nocardia huaxiensis]
MTSLDMPVVRSDHRVDALPIADATTYASWFACLADPTRVRLLHHVAAQPAGTTIGEIAEALGVGQPTVSHHVRKLAEVGFVRVHKDRTSTIVAINPACCTGLPHAADVVMGVLPPQPCCPADIPSDVTVRALTADDWDAVRRIYGEGIATGVATFATEIPAAEVLDRTWLPGHRWVAEIDGEIVGWAAATPVSEHDYYRGVAETSIYVAEDMRGRGVGKALLRTQVLAADQDGLWTLQHSTFPENRAGIALHHSAGFRTVGVRERIAQLNGQWRDTVLLERRSGGCA